MKTLVTFFLIFISSSLFSQEIEELSVTQNGDNQIKAHLKVYLPASSESLSYITNTNQNIITINACYYMIGTGETSFFEKDFYIDIPDNSDYTLKVNLYISWDETTCDYHSLEDTKSLNFHTPIEGVISLASHDIENRSDKILLFPNPTKGIFSIKAKVKPDKINIYDATGKLALTIHDMGNTIDVSRLPNGTYYLELSDKTGKFRKKFLINK